VCVTVNTNTYLRRAVLLVICYVCMTYKVLGRSFCTESWSNSNVTEGCALKENISHEVIKISNDVHLSSTSR